MRRALTALALTCAPAAPALGTVFAMSNLFTVPDGLYTWDSTSPDAAQGFKATGVSFAANFVLGLYMTGPGSGYYMVTYTESGPNLKGLYRMDNGVSTQLGAMPFSAPTYAGLTTSADGAALLTIGDSNWNNTAIPYRMYRVGLDGAFTLMGDIVTPGIADPEIKGLTRDPVSGLLYAYEQTTDVLLTINETTLTTSVVGSLGFNAFAAGGMAFSPDGSVLALHSSDDILRSVNTQTGAATTILGTFGSDGARAAALSAVPIPAPGTLVVVGLACLARRRRRV